MTSRILQLIPSSLGHAQTAFFYGQVSQYQPLPASFSDSLYVVAPDRDSDTFEEILGGEWPQLYGSTLPANGNPCLLIYDNRDNLRLVWWGKS